MIDVIEITIEEFKNDIYNEYIKLFPKDEQRNWNKFEFYKRLGFKKIESEYLLYNVYYNPIVYCESKNINKELYDRIFFDYYLINCGENEVKKNCKIIR